jgi:hypothetical protein
VTIIFPCLAYRHEVLGDIIQPYASVILRHGQYSFVGEFLIDSGADISLIPRGVGELLGLTSGEGEINDVGDLQATLPAVYREVEMQIGEERLHVRLAWALTEDVPLILGRLDVFDFFDIEFRQRERCTIFRRSSSTQAAPPQYEGLV